MAPSTPSKIGKYDVIEVLGRGGMGVVYKAKDPLLGRLVAIKMTAGVGDNPELASRFFREAQSTASLQHPNIVTVYELGDWSGNPYLVMEYLEGRSLDTIIAGQRPLSLLNELDIIMDVCKGLGYAHQRSIIHRDIKPANIVVTKMGVVKLVDFGIAHIVGRKLTLPGQVIGSFNYMSPEQINSKQIDARTDIFSAGIVLYQLITKVLPFEGDTPTATLRKIVNEAPPPLGKFLNVYPPELEKVILRALAKNRDERYPTIEDFANDLRQVRERVRDEMVALHLQEAASLMDADALAKAKEEVFQALKLDPHHTRAGQVMRQIQRRMQGLPAKELASDTGTQSARQASAPDARTAAPPPPRRVTRLDECIEEARREIGLRRFSSALEILKEAQELDTNSPQVRELLTSVTAARDKEIRAQELNAAGREIHSAIRWEDFSAAAEKSEAALQKFPGDPGLQKLKAVAEQRRADAERSQRIDQELISAQALLGQDRDDEVIALLQEAGKKFGSDSRVEALLHFVRENSDRRKLQKHRNDCLQAAKEQLLRKDYAAATRTLQMAGSEFKDNAEIEALLQIVRDEAASEQRRSKVAAAAERARNLISARTYADAIKLLEGVLSDFPEEELQVLLAQARREAAAHRRKYQSAMESAEKLLNENNPEQALLVLEAVNALFSSDSAFAALLERTRREAEKFRQIQEAITEARNLAGSGQFESARAHLAECKSRVGSSLHIEQELVRIEQQRIAENTRRVEKALEDARKLAAASEYESAIERLSAITGLLADVPTVLRSKVEEQQKQASEAIVRRVRSEVESYIAAGQITYAQDALSRTSTNLTVFKALSDLEALVNNEAKRRLAASRALEEARNMLTRSEWQPAAELLKRALVFQVRVPKLHDEIVAEFLYAAEGAATTDWRLAEQILKQFREAEPQHPLPASLLGKIADKRRDEAVTACLERSKALELKGDLQGARREISQLSATYPADSRLSEVAQALDRLISEEEQRARQEKARREQEAIVAEAIRRSDAETNLDLRANILAEAQQKYPDSRIENRLNQVRDFRQRLEEMAQSAKAREDDGEYESAVAKWSALRQAYPHYPGIDERISRLEKLHSDTRGLARGAWLEKLNKEIASGGLENAAVLLTEAISDFPFDQELLAMQARLQNALKTRSRAKGNLDAAHDAFARRRWDTGRRAILKACQTALDDSVIWEQAMKEVVNACESSHTQDPAFTELIARELADLGSSFPLPKELATHVKQPRVPAPAANRDWSTPKVMDYPAVSDNLARASGPSATEAFNPAAFRSSATNMPTPATPAGMSSSISGTNSKFPEETIRAIEKRLAMIVGPLARVYLQRALPQAASVDGLFSLLASNLVTETDRQMFLSAKGEILSKSGASVLPTPAPDVAARTTMGTPNPQIDSKAMERTTQILARYVGPIAGVLVKRAAARAQNIRELSLMVAERVDDGQRANFLQECGISNDR